jgi:hypothetical protein
MTVTVFEAADQPGGQVRLTAQTKRRSEMIGIIDWRMAQCAARGEFRFNTWAEAADVLAEKPRCGDRRHRRPAADRGLEAGNDLVVSAWDILSGDVKPGSNVLLYDDAGDHTALQAAEVRRIGRHGRGDDPRPQLCPRGDGDEPGALHAQPAGKDVTFTVTYRLRRGGARRQPAEAATIGSDYITDLGQQKHYDQIVVNHGTGSRTRASIST